MLRTRAEKPKELRTPAEKQLKSSADSIAPSVVAQATVAAPRNDYGASSNASQGRSSVS